jgi:hypothetical protein
MAQRSNQISNHIITYCTRFIEVQAFIKQWCWSHSLFQTRVNEVLYIIFKQITKVVQSIEGKKIAFVKVRVIIKGADFLAFKLIVQAENLKWLVFSMFTNIN